MKTRAAIARESAGLSIRQAARLLDLTEDEVARTEVFDGICIVHADRLCDVYRVNREWLLGEVPQHDYARVDKIEGAENLSFHDRDIIAQFVASMPRSTVPASERLAKIEAMGRRNVGGD